MATKAPRVLVIFQFVLWGLLLAAAAYMFLPRLLVQPGTVTEGPAGVSVTMPSLGPGVPMDAPFRLVNQDGVSVSEANFAGKPGAWFYGFTHCPDVCPTALAEMASLLAELGSDAEKLNAVFVTVDPERDTVEIMKDYVSYFDPRIVGLTGTLPAVEAMAATRMVRFEKMPDEAGGYAMQHPASIYLVDADGTFAGTLDAEEGMAVKLAKLKKLIGA